MSRKLDEIKSIDKPKTRIGILVEVMGYKNGKEAGKEICLSFKKEYVEITAWFRREDIDRLFSIDYSKIRQGG